MHTQDSAWDEHKTYSQYEQFAATTFGMNILIKLTVLSVQH